MPSYTSLHGVTDIDARTLIEQLQVNLMEFFNWGLLEVGGYTEVYLDPTDPTGDDTLLPKKMPGQPDGKLWQAKNRNWIWEDSLSSSRQPIAVSGVYIGNQFFQSGTTGIYSHKINYPQGMVVFDNAIPTNSEVRVEHSYRWLNFYNQDVPWFRDVIFDSLRYEVGEDALPSGVIGLLNKNSIQLPAVVVETVASRKSIPRQIGDLSQTVYQDFILHVLAETGEDRDTIIDVVSLQKDKTFYLFDMNARAAANSYSLDWHGSKVPGSKMYPQLVEPHPTGFQWKKCTFDKIVGQETSIYLPLFRSTIRVTLEVIQ